MTEQSEREIIVRIIAERVKVFSKNMPVLEGGSVVDAADAILAALDAHRAQVSVGHEALIAAARRATDCSPSSTYPSMSAARHIRDLVVRLADALEAATREGGATTCYECDPELVGPFCPVCNFREDPQPSAPGAVGVRDLILAHMRASGSVAWPFESESGDPNDSEERAMFCGFLSYEQLDKLAEALAAAPPPHATGAGWRTIDSAPRDMTFVIVASPLDERRALAAYQHGRWYGVDNCGLTFDSKSQQDEPTHWQPLPAAPATDPRVDGDE